jgi:RHS repeat-associated protein
LMSLAPGNQLTTNTWDGENRLTITALPSGIVDSFTYNGDGLRVQKQDTTGTTNHVWDGQNILLETNASNIIQVVYSLQPMLYGNLVSQWRSGTASFYLFDGVGSATQLANSTGSVTDSYLYDAWGNIILANGSTVNPFRYLGRVGYYYDSDLAQYYLRARYYSPTRARFLSRDPLGMSDDPNTYRYALNRSINLFDPSGLQSADEPTCEEIRDAQLWACDLIFLAGDVECKARVRQCEQQNPHHADQWFDPCVAIESSCNARLKSLDAACRAAAQVEYHVCQIGELNLLKFCPLPPFVLPNIEFPPLPKLPPFPIQFPGSGGRRRRPIVIVF